MLRVLHFLLESILCVFICRLTDFFCIIMVNCCVPGCTNHSARNKGTGISFHKIPNDKSLRKAWVARMRRDNLPPLENCYNCSEHFTENCFVADLKAQLVPGQSVKRRLKRDSIPSLFPFAPQPSKNQRTSNQ